MQLKLPNRETDPPMAITTKNFVHLTKDERSLLEKHTKSGDWTPKQVIRAKILLLSDVNGPDALTDVEIAKRLGCSRSTVYNRRRRFANTQSVEDSIFDNPKPGRPTIIDGAVDAHMTAIACSTPPDGHAKWTLRLVKDRMVALEVIDEISHTTVARALKKKKLNLG